MRIEPSTDRSKLKSNALTNCAMGWLKPVATVLLMLCSAVFVECLVLNPCCVVMFGMFCVMYGRIIFSSVFAITDRGILACMMSQCYVFVRFGDRYDVGQFPYMRYLVIVGCSVVYVREVL